MSYLQAGPGILWASRIGLWTKNLFSLQSILSRTTKSVRLHGRGGMENDSQRVPAGFPTPTKCRDVGKLTKDMCLSLRGAAGVCYPLKGEV